MQLVYWGLGSGVWDLGFGIYPEGYMLDELIDRQMRLMDGLQKLGDYL